MISLINDEQMEIRSDRWQSVVAVCIFGVMLFFSAWFTLSVIFPTTFQSADHFELMSWSTRWIYLVLSVIPGMVGLYVYGSTVNYRLYFDERGIGQSDSFRTVFVMWGDIISYRIERTGPFHNNLYEPIIIGRDSAVVLRPSLPAVMISNGGRRERAVFWKRVIDAIEQNNRK